MGVGRFMCVALPFALTLGALICLLITALSGVTAKGLFLFQVDLHGLTISSAGVTLDKRLTVTTGGGTSTVNVTAADLGLPDYYRASLFSYCNQTNAVTSCSSFAYNWASNAANFTQYSALAASVDGITVSIPNSLTDALKTFSTVLHWTEIVFSIAFGATILELVMGLFAIFSRVGSCGASLVSGFQTVATIATAIMATVLGSFVVGAIEASSKAYGVKASLSGPYIAITWLAAAFSIASGLFWAFTICCCAPNHSSRKDKHRSTAGDMSMQQHQGYQRVNDPFAPTAYAGTQYPMTQMRGRQADPAYEPYSHSGV